MEVEARCAYPEAHRRNPETHRGRCKGSIANPEPHDARPEAYRANLEGRGGDLEACEANPEECTDHPEPYDANREACAENPVPQNTKPEEHADDAQREGRNLRAVSTYPEGLGGNREGSRGILDRSPETGLEDRCSAQSNTHRSQLQGSGIALLFGCIESLELCHLREFLRQRLGQPAGGLSDL